MRKCGLAFVGKPLSINPLQAIIELFNGNSIEINGKYGSFSDMAFRTHMGSVALTVKMHISIEQSIGLCPYTDLFCQHIKLLSKSHLVSSFHHHLTFANHVHEFNASQDVFS